MSTRATYLIDGHCFYIHHDGYPMGAAQYFDNAVKYRSNPERSPNASLADDFSKANVRAELTGGHDTHGDTEYRYTIGARDTSALTVHKRIEFGETWQEIYHGSLADFIQHELAKLAKAVAAYEARQRA